MLIVMATMVVTSVMVVMLKIAMTYLVICQNLPKKWTKSCLGALPNKPSF